MTLIEQALARIEEMEQRAEGATPGPWEAIDDPPDVWVCPAEDYAVDPQGAIGEDEAQRNREFMASARTDLPALCALVKALIAYFDMPGSRHPSEIQYIEAETVAAIKAFTEAK